MTSAQLGDMRNVFIYCQDTVAMEWKNTERSSSEESLGEGSVVTTSEKQQDLTRPQKAHEQRKALLVVTLGHLLEVLQSISKERRSCIGKGGDSGKEQCIVLLGCFSCNGQIG